MAQDPMMYIKVAANIADLKAAMAEARTSVEQAGEAAKTAGQHWQSMISDLNVKEAIENPVTTARQALSGFMEQLGSTGTLALEVAGGLSALGVAAFGLASRAAEAGDRLGDLADKTGLSVPALSRYGNAASATGHDLEGLTSAFFMLQRGMGEGSQTLATGLDRIGLSADQLRDTNMDEWLALIAERFEATLDPSTRAAAVMEIFGKQGRELLPVLLDLEKGLKATSDVTPWTKAQADAAEQFEIQMKSAKIHVEALALALGRDLMGPIGSVAGWFKDAAVGVWDFDRAIGGLPQTLEDIRKTWQYGAAAIDLWTGSVDTNAEHIDNNLDPALTRWKQSVDDLMAKPLTLSLFEQTQAEKALAESMKEANAEREQTAAILKKVHDLERGIAAEREAGLLGLSKIEQETTQKDLERHVAGYDQIGKAHAALMDQIAKETLSSSDYQVVKVWATFEEQKKAYKGAAENYQQYVDTILELATHKEQAIREAEWATMADEKHSLDVLIGGAKDVAEAHTAAADECQKGYQIAFYNAGGGFAAFKGAVIQGNQDLIASVFGVRDAYANVLNAIGVPSATPGLPRTVGFQTRQSGGPVAAQTPYLVGERGPELFVPQQSGSIVATGGSSLPAIHITINGSVLSDETKIARAVGDALVSRLRTMGVRLPLA